MLLSITGLFRTVLILIGIFLALRYLSRFALKRREMEEERSRQKAKQDFLREKKESKEREGEVKIMNSPDFHAEDVDFEDVD